MSGRRITYGLVGVAFTLIGAGFTLLSTNGIAVHVVAPATPPEIQDAPVSGFKRTLDRRHRELFDKPYLLNVPITSYKQRICLV